MAQFIIMAFSIISTFVLIRRIRVDKGKLIAGFITGFIITILNTILEWLGVKLDVYYVSGPLVFIKTPLPLFIAWIFFTFIYCSIFEVYVRGERMIIKGAIYILIGIIAGWFFDFTAYKWLSMLTLGGSGNPFIIAFIWIVFIPLTIILYKLISSYIE